MQKYSQGAYEVRYSMDLGMHGVATRDLNISNTSLLNIPCDLVVSACNLFLLLIS